MQARRIPEYMRAIFSNAVVLGGANSSSSSSSRQPAGPFEARLGAIGFKQVQQKSTCSMHVLHKAPYAAYAISLMVDNG